MLLYYLAAFCVASTAAFRVPRHSNQLAWGDAEELRWAESYSVKATKASLTSSLIEDFSAWKTNQSSRVDYNQGAVKVITILPKNENGNALKFEIHPETTNEELNEIVCHFTTSESNPEGLVLDEILPSLTDEAYEDVGNETIGDSVPATRFEYIEKTRENDVRKTIWAYYSDVYGWIPLKFEDKKFNVVLGSLIKHEIWDFFEYYPDDVEEDVFNAEKFGCENETMIEHTADSTKITKELLFINANNDKHVDHVFNHFKNKYNREYAHEREHALRKSIFSENVKMVSRVNRQNLPYKLGINKFSDWTPAEFKKTLGAIPRPEGLKATVAFPYEENDIKDELENVPKEYDMRLEGLISPIKDQGMCGSCWTFAATAVTESGLARVNGGKVLSLANQAIIDCAYEDLKGGFGGGCDGGFDFAAYNFIEEYGLPTVQEYGSYKMRDGYCNIDNMTTTYSIKGYTTVTQYSPNAMKVAAFKRGPLFIYINVSDKFAAYSSGIFYQAEKECNPERPNHAVALVGYGEKYGDLYWILKNSWGDNWGEDGYMLISAKDNVCGVASSPSYPVF